MYRQKSFEPEGVEFCLDIKGYGNAWFMLCGCYHSEIMCNISDFITSCEMTAEGMLAKWKDIIFSGDYNMDMNLSPDNVHGPHQVFSNFWDQFCLTNVIWEPTRIIARLEGNRSFRAKYFSQKSFSTSFGPFAQFLVVISHNNHKWETSI